MDSSRKQSVIARVPFVTIALVATALVVWFVPGLQRAFIFDREMILRGQAWRLFTGHFVHFSASHLACDVAVIAMAGASLERSSRADFAILCLATSIVTGIGLLLLQPGTHFYGGLSALAMGFVVVLGIQWLRTPGKARWLGGLVLALTASKLFIETHQSAAMFVDLSAGVHLSRGAHILGAITGAAWSPAFRRWGFGEVIIRRVHERDRQT
jgi:rhomboid family GlyGly-CTERM serine protease